MKAHEAIKEIKKLLGFKAEFVAVKTITGDQLKWEGDLKEGTPVFMITPDGDIPAPDGEYQLEDGNTLVVAGGLAVELRPPTEEPVPIEEEEIGMTAEELTALFDWLFGFKKQYEEMKSELEAVKGENTELKKRVDEFMAAPKDEPVKNKFVENERLTELQKAMQKVLNNR